jgi:thioredoxin 1
MRTRFSDDASFAGLNFAKVDVDENPELSQEFGITAMPTFILVKNGIKEGEVRGANPPALQALVQKGAA